MARAICALFFFALPTLGCSPDLAREAGRLELTVTRIDPAVERLEVRLERPDGEPFADTLAPTGAQAFLIIESVPAGRVDLTVRALAAGAVLQSWRGPATILGDQTARVTAPLGAGEAPIPSVSSDPIAVDIGTLSGADISGGRLIGSGSVPTAPLDAFLARARQALEQETLAEVGVAAVTVRIDVAAAREVEDIRDAWRDFVEVELTDGATGVVVARGPPPEDVASMTVEPVAAADPTGLLVGGAPLMLEVRGNAKSEATDDFSVPVTVTVVLFARAG